MSLFELADRLAQSGEPEIALESTRCLHSLNKLASCTACFELCPTAAIQSGKPPSLNQQACVSCRACLSACPVGAYAGEDKVKDLLSAAARAVKKHKVAHIDLLCDRHASPTLGPQDSALGLRVEGCLAQLGAGAYLALFVLGIEKITVRLDDCAQCAWGALQTRCIEQIKQAQALASPWGLGGGLNILDQAASIPLQARPGWNTATPPLSRADLLHPATLLVESKYAQLVSPDSPATSQSRLSLDRYRQILASQHLVARELSIQDNLKVQAEGVRAVVNDSCTGCNVCSRACPTGALRLTVLEEKDFKLRFASLKCVDCQVCVALCPEDAISLEKPAWAGYMLAGEFAVRQGSLVKCQRCGTFFSPKAGEKFCHTCQYRRENPFGSRLAKIKPS